MQRVAQPARFFYGNFPTRSAFSPSLSQPKNNNKISAFLLSQRAEAMSYYLGWNWSAYRAVA
jgi:hypothetical protein